MPADTSTTVPGLDLDVVGRWLGELGVAAPPVTARRIGDGQSNITCLVTDGAGRLTVVRRPPLGRRLGSAHDVVREARVLAALAATAVPVPVVLGVHADGGTDGAPLVAMTFVEGTPVGPATLGSLTPVARRAIGQAMARTLAAVHAVDIDAVGLGDLGSRSPYALRQLRRWSGQWEASRRRDLPALDALTQRLRAQVPPQREVRLVHGDLHPANVLVDPATGEVAAALDWELCALGDPLADLGTLLAYWPDAGEETIMPFSVSAAPGFVRRADIVAEYADASGREVDAVGFWYVLGLWKVAIICEGIVRRVEDDHRNRADGWVATRDMVDALVERATAAADTELRHS